MNSHTIPLADGPLGVRSFEQDRASYALVFLRSRTRGLDRYPAVTECIMAPQGLWPESQHHEQRQT